jgi:hypothetical protein
MWMSVAVTPMSVAVLAPLDEPLDEPPGLHTFARSPKPPFATAVSPPPEDEDDPVELDALVSADGLPLLLHDAVTSTKTTASATPRNRFISCSPRIVFRSNVQLWRITPCPHSRPSPRRCRRDPLAETS